MGGGSLGRNWLAGACLPGLALMSVTSPRPSCKVITKLFCRSINPEIIKIDYYEATERQIKNDDRVNPASSKCERDCGQQCAIPRKFERPNGVLLVEGGLIRVQINDNHRNQTTYVTEQATHVAYSSGNYVTWLPRILRHIESQWFRKWCDYDDDIIMADNRFVLE